MSLLRAKPLDFESTWLVLQRQVVSWLVYCLPCAASGCSPYGACARVMLRTGCVWFVLRERQVSRLVIDLSEGVSHSEFMQMHTLIYKLCTISQDPGGEAKAGELMTKEVHPRELCSSKTTWDTWCRSCKATWFDW